MRKINYTLKFCVTGKKSRQEVKMILQDATTLLELNLQSEFCKAELVNQRASIHLPGCPPKTFCLIKSYLGPMLNIFKISFETKIATQILLDIKLQKEYAFLQQTQWHEVNKTDDFTKNK